MPRRTLILIVVVLLIAGGVLLFREGANGPMDKNDTSLNIPSGSASPSPAMAGVETSADEGTAQLGQTLKTSLGVTPLSTPDAKAAILAKMQSDKGTKSALLTAVAKSSGESGIAFRLVENRTLYFAVVALLDAPITGAVYEGWLSDSGGTLQNLGKLEKDIDGNWTIVYSGTGTIASYDNILITEELTADAIPETHVLEGAFE